MLYGSGEFSYELVDGWARLPEGQSFYDVCGIAIGDHDRVYILNRGNHPVMVFDRNGDLKSQWGEGYFGRAHGSCIGSDASIYCTDDRTDYRNSAGYRSAKNMGGIVFTSRNQRKNKDLTGLPKKEGHPSQQQKIAKHLGTSHRK